MKLNATTRLSAAAYEVPQDIMSMSEKFDIDLYEEDGSWFAEDDENEKQINKFLKALVKAGYKASAGPARDKQGNTDITLYTKGDVTVVHAKSAHENGYPAILAVLLKGKKWK